MKSDILKKDIETLPHRSLLRATGLKDEDFNKPFIGIANSFNDIVPGHIHLNKLTDEVARGIKDAGGVPFRWGVPGVCDGIAMHVEMRLSLPSREHIADNIEIMMLSHSLDGWVGVTNCDKITPGMLIATGRLNLPAIILTGGAMKPGKNGARKTDLIGAFEAIGKIKHGENVSKEEIKSLECEACPGAGSCAGLFTANTMACMTEVLGLSLTGCATTLALSNDKMKQAYESGKKIVELVKKDIKPRDIITKNSFYNAIMVDMAIGGSTNTALHLPEIAKAYSLDVDLKMFDEISKTTPNICKISPSGTYYIEDLNLAGGIPAVLNRLQKRLKEAKTINGKTITEIAKTSKILDNEVIRPLDNPYYNEGGIAILKGNIANTSVVKQSAVSKEMLIHTGPAKVFYSENELIDAIPKGEIKEGDVIVLPFQGLKGAPGMPEMLTPTSLIMGAGYTKVALITDGRFSGGTRGPCIGHIEPEAYIGGAIGAIKDGDIIEIDMPQRKINVKLTDAQIKERLKNVKAPKRKMTNLLQKIRDG